VTPARRGRGNKPKARGEEQRTTPGQRARVNRVNIRTDQNENRCKPLLSRNRPQNGGFYFSYTQCDRLVVDSGLLFENALPLAHSGVSVLAPPDMVLHSAAHLFRTTNFDNTLRDLSDIDLLIQEFSQTDGFWDTLVARTTDLNLRSPCSHALRLTRMLFETPVPATVCEIVEGRKQPGITNRLFDALVRRTLVPRYSDRFDSLRALCRGALSYSPPPRFSVFFTPLFWTKRL